MGSDKTILRGFLSLTLFSVAITIMKSFELMSQHEIRVVAKDGIGNVPIEEMKAVGPEPLAHEQMFTDTLKDCMPSTELYNNDEKRKKECKTFVPEGLSKERIAIMVPPGDIDASLMHFIRFILRKGRKVGEGEGGSAATHVDVIPTTNIAPYGYGKTHGYTRIVRIVPQPLLLGATTSLRATVESISNLSLNDITLDDLRAALRQQIRYHCRLNHVAAHTAMWTIGVESFAETAMPWIVDSAQSFLGLDLKQSDSLNEDILEDYDDNSRLVELNHMYSEGSRLLTLLQRKAKAENPTNDILKMLDDVLLDEMRISDNLTAWPCESFWTVGEPGSRLEISPIVSSISKAMSPNCTAPYTSCFVKKDKCEAKGDGRCK